MGTPPFDGGFGPGFPGGGVVPGDQLPDVFDIDVQFEPIQFDGDYPDITELCPETGCFCVGDTDIPTAAAITCGNFCAFTRGKECLSNIRCITQGARTCVFVACGTVVTCQKASTCFGCFQTHFHCTPEGTNPPECG